MYSLFSMKLDICNLELQIYKCGKPIEKWDMAQHQLFQCLTFTKILLMLTDLDKVLFLCEDWESNLLFL